MPFLAGRLPFHEKLYFCSIVHMQLYDSQTLAEWLEIADTKFDCQREKKVCVVGIIGKWKLEDNTSKIQLINENLIKKNAFNSAKRPSKCGLDIYFDANKDTIYLHVTSFMDCNSLDSVMKETGPEDFLNSIDNLEVDYYQILFVVFLLSHIVIIIEPTTRLDTQYIKTLKHLNRMREDSLTMICETLSTIPNLPENWTENGRMSTARLLFIMQNAPVRFDMGAVKKKELLDKMASNLEDQIYNLFRKSRVITNSSSQSMCALPENDNFVLVLAPNDSVNSKHKFMVQNLMKSFSSMPKPFSPTSSLNSTLNSTVDSSSDENSTRNSKPNEVHEFVMAHIDAALSKGFNDNVGRGTAPALFELPRLKQFTRVARKLFELICVNNETEKLDVLRDCDQYLHVEKVFSDRRCAKVLPLALSKYQDGLPAFYTRLQHETQLAAAVQSLCALARGPKLGQAVEDLKTDCDREWHNGKQACEALSLTGNNCVHKLHRLPDDEIAETELPVQKHASSAVYLHTCNCGHKQQLREDPFDLKEANFDFYQSNAFYCCMNLQKMEFPIFVPPEEGDTDSSLPLETSDLEQYPTLDKLKLSTPGEENGGSTAGEFLLDRDNRANTNPGSEISSSEQEDEQGSDGQVSPSQREQLSQPEEETGAGSLAEVLNHIQDDENYLMKSGGSDEAGMIENSGPEEMTLDPDGQILTSRDYVPDKQQPTLTSSPSAAVLYKRFAGLILEGMPHSLSPHNLLPFFPSWSLLCIGSSNLYIHATGLRDQPNFSHGSHYLLPLDVALKVDNEKWFAEMQQLTAQSAYSNAARRHTHKGNKTGNDSVWVKLFVGYEYECPRGHRFMMQSPSRILKHSGPGGPKDSASLITKNDMPLWFPCSCRSQPPLNGQLMRIHIVTPKAPVTVALTPKVNTSLSQGIFFHPGARGVTHLLSAKYYIMRLPYCYEGPNGPILPPKEQISAGRFCKSAITLTADL